MASTLYIQLVSKSFAEQSDDWHKLAFPFCLVAGNPLDNAAGKTILQQGKQSFSDLSEIAQNASSVVLLMAASDVSVMKVKVPPIPYAKIKLALPNLLEEQLLADPSDCLFVSNPPKDGVCLVATIARSWMEKVLAAAAVLGARRLSAYAMSKSLLQENGETSILIESASEVATQLNLSFKFPDQLAAGLTVDTGASAANSPEVCQQINDTVQLLAPQGAYHFYVDAAMLAPLQASLAEKLNEEIANPLEVPPAPKFSVLNWHHKIAGMD
ncbi:MAG: hypothetical protein K2P84_09125, partial [Undibacterium sp.]|nr:hypothetical protein [Undibacterium sp.]